MLIDRTHKPWIVGSALVFAIAASAYWATAKHSVHGPTGGSVLGLILGIVGSLLMVFAALLAVRKRLPTWRVGSAQFWLRGHLWLGTLGFVLILFHAGFHWGGLLENLLWISFGLVVITGFAGVGLQQVIPRLLTTRVPLETMVAQIPFLSRTMQFRADQLVAKQAGVLDVDYESLKPFAEEVLKQQRVLKRESDFPKELAKVYANVPLPEADAKKAHAPAPADIVSTKAPPTSPLPPGESGRRPGENSGTSTPPNAPPAASVETTPAAKPKSPLELMREKAAAKSAGGETVAPASANAGASPTAEPTKKLSPIEQMRAKAAAKPTTEAAVTSEPTPEAIAPAAEKKLSPIEQMRAKMAAKSAAPVAPPTVEASPATPAPVAEVTPPVDEKKLSPIEQMRAKMAAKSAAPPAPVAPPTVEASPAAPASVIEATPPAAEKKLSPIEQMRAKMAAKQAAAPVAAAVVPPTDEASSAAPPPTIEATAPVAEKKLSPIEQMRAKMAAKQAPTPSTAATAAETPAATTSEKKLSPLEQMQAKLAAAKAPSADKPAEIHKPLTVEKPSADDKPAPPAAKKPAPVVKPTVEKPVAAAPSKTAAKAAAPVPPALLAELRDFHIRVVRPFLSNGRSPQHRLDDSIAARRVFAQLRSDLPAELHDALQELEDLCDERRQFNTQLRLHRWLHWWLILHIPPSIALLVLFVAHVIVSLRVVPFGK